MSIFTKFIFAVMVIAAGLWAIPAFPGAEGWGQDALGGRGGQVIHVTNTNSYGAGSLANACGVSGAKIIVFDVSGVINRSSTPLMVNSNTTIAGQTSPNGITIINGGIYASNGSNNIIIRHIRVRRSPDRADGDCFRFPRDCHDIIVDHCSAIWCSDEVLDCSYNTYNITFQNTVVSSPCQCFEHYGSGSGNGNNRTGVLSTGVQGRHTFYKCLLSHMMKRAPYLSNNGGSSPTGQTFELINNVFYNNMQGGNESFTGNTIPLNLIGNYYKGGANAYPSTSAPWYHSGTMQPPQMIAHVDGNRHFEWPQITVPAAFFNRMSIIGDVAGFQASPIAPVRTTNILDVQIAYDAVLAGSGAWPRDSADRRVTNEVATKTGAWVQACDPNLDPYNPSGGTVPTDTDQDGMPDSWETAHSLNPNNASDRTTPMNGGYNAVEVYLNELADNLVPSTITKPFRVNTIDGMHTVLANPNPFSAGVRFSLHNFDNAPVRVTVTDISGRVVYRTAAAAGETTVAWDGRALSPGVYVAQFVQGKKTYQMRVSLIR
jgi:hypothetical protein